MARAAPRDHRRGKKAGGQGKAVAAARAVVAAPPTARPLPAPLPPAPPPPPTVAVTFSISHRVAYGQSIAVVGSASALGGWSLASAIPLAWSDGDVWRTTVPLPAGSLVEYKYVVIDGSTGGADAWQRGNNSVLAVGDPSSSPSSSASSTTLELYDNWEGAPGAAVVAPDGVAGTREGRLAEWASSVSTSLATARADLRSARLELAAATSDAAAARAEAEGVKAALAEAEAGRVAAVAVAQELRAANAALKAQLVDNAASFRAAMAEVTRLLEADD